MANKIINLETLDRDCKEQLKKLETALFKRDMQAYQSAKVMTERYIAAYNKQLCKDAYAEFMADKKPMKAAIKKFYIDKRVLKELRDKDHPESITGVKLDDTKQARIDLLDFCNECNLPTDWAVGARNLLDLIALREVNVFQLSDADIANESYFFMKKVKEIKDGETPASNTKIVKLIQAIIDKVLPEFDEKGNNAYKCTNQDILFITKASVSHNTKEKCSLKVAKERQFRNIMLDVFAHCLGEQYKVKVQAKKKED